MNADGSGQRIIEDDVNAAADAKGRKTDDVCILQCNGNCALQA